MERQTKNEVRCAVCLKEFLLKKTKECPNCKTEIHPLLIKEDGYIKINWQDMRVLSTYAVRWATCFDLTKKGNADAAKALSNILVNIKNFRPTGAEKLVDENDKIVERNMENQEKDGGIPSPYQIEK